MTLKNAQGLKSILEPGSVAVVGASDNPDKVGGRPIKYLIDQGFKGRIYAVNPRAQTVQGLPAYASLDELPEVPDAAILCVGASQIVDQLHLCAKLGVANAISFASGYAETGEDGLRRQDELARICRDGGVRLLGPNSIGVSNFSNGAVLSFASAYIDHPPLDGPISIVSQSGGIGVTAYAMLRSAGWGVRCVAATGNESDIDVAEFLDELSSDEVTGVILLYLEDIKDEARLESALAKALANNIPILALRAGGTLAGRNSAMLHTGSHGAAEEAQDVLFARHGCRSLTSLNQTVLSTPLYLAPAWRALSTAARPEGVALISNSGAACVLSADQAVRRGLPIAPLSADSCAALDAILPDFSLSRNPVDLTAVLLSDSSLLGRAVEVVLDDPHVDSAVMGLLAIGGPSYDTDRFARDSAAAAKASAKPLVFYSPHTHVRAIFAAHGHAVFEDENSAMTALEGFFEHRAAFQRLNKQTQIDGNPA